MPTPHPTRSRGDRRLSPSIRRAHRRVQWAWYASWAHGALFLVLAGYVLSREPRSWFVAVACLAAGTAAPLLGRAAYLGNSFRAFLLLLLAVVPPGGLFLLDWSPGIVLAGLLFAPFYYVGLKGAIGLRGRRGSRRGRPTSS